MQITFEASSLDALTKQMIDFLASIRTPSAQSTDTAPAQPETAKVGYTLEDVRARFARLVQSGQAEKAKQILAALGAQKLGELPEEKYLKAVQSADALLG